VFAYLADELQEGEVLHPIVVVDEFRRVRGVGVEVEEPGELLLEAIDVVLQGGLVEEVTFLRLARWVADHARGTAYQGDRFVPRALEVT